MASKTLNLLKALPNKLGWSLVLPVALLLAALLIFNWLLRDRPTIPGGERRAPPPMVVALGGVSMREMVELRPQVEGRAEWLGYDLGPGSTLEKDQPLLRMEAESYQLARLREEGIDLTEAIKQAAARRVRLQAGFYMLSNQSRRNSSLIAIGFGKFSTTI